MRTGTKHDRASAPGVLTHTLPGTQLSFAIQICGQYLGVLFISNDVQESQLVVWDWQTGAREMVRLVSLGRKGAPSNLYYHV